MTKSQLKIKSEQEAIIKQSLLKIAKLPAVKKLQKIIDDAAGVIKNLKEECKHENATIEYSSNTGNYDLYEEYFVSARCKDCKLHEWGSTNSDKHIYDKWVALDIKYRYTERQRAEERAGENH